MMLGSRLLARLPVHLATMRPCRGGLGRTLTTFEHFMPRLAVDVQKMMLRNVCPSHVLRSEAWFTHQLVAHG